MYDYSRHPLHHHRAHNRAATLATDKSTAAEPFTPDVLVCFPTGMGFGMGVY